MGDRETLTECSKQEFCLSPQRRRHTLDLQDSALYSEEFHRVLMKDAGLFNNIKPI